MKKIGMVGIGMMGHGIAANLLRHGHALTLFEHPGNQPTGDLQPGAWRIVTDAERASLTAALQRAP